MSPVSFLWRSVGPATHDEQVKLHLEPDRTVARSAHLRMLDGRPYAYELTSIPLDRLQPMDSSAGIDVRALAAANVVALGLATESIAEVAADWVTAARLGVAEGDLLWRLDRTTETREGQPIEWRVSYVIK